jgi:hypothetical protein
VERHLQGVAPTTLRIAQKLVKAVVDPLLYQCNSLLGKLGGEGGEATGRPKHIVDANHRIVVVVIIFPCREVVVCRRREEVIVLVDVVVGIFVVIGGTCGEIYKVSEFSASTTKTNNNMLTLFS